MIFILFVSYMYLYTRAEAKDLRETKDWGHWVLPSSGFGNSLAKKKIANQDVGYVVSVHFWITPPFRMSNMYRNYVPDILVGDFFSDFFVGFFRIFCSV